MPEFTVKWRGTLEETYVFEADSEEHAREIWSDFNPDVSEAIDGEVTEVTLVDDGEDD